MTYTKVVISARVDKSIADKLLEIADHYTLPGEKVEISLAVREACRQFVESWQSTPEPVAQ